MKSKTDDKLKDNVQATQLERHAGENSRFTEGEAVHLKYGDDLIPGIVTGWTPRRVHIDTGITVCVKIGEGVFKFVDAARVKQSKRKGAKK